MNRIYIKPMHALAVLTFALLLFACGKDEDQNNAQTRENMPTASQPMTATEEMEKMPQKSEPSMLSESASDVAQPEAQPETSQVETMTEITMTAEQETTQEQPDTKQQAMLTLARKSGCLACHSVDKKVVGPAWRDVAARYKGDSNARARLVEKVAKGGKGNWTEVVGNAAMPPYFPRVSKENIEQLVDFILSLAES